MALTKVTGGTISTTSDYQINNIVGVAGTFTTLNVSGVLTYEDVTNIESVGVATFKDDVEFHGTGAGISSAFWDKSANEFKFKDNVKLSFGDGRDIQLSHNGSDSVISHIGSATGALKILSGGAQSIECIKAGAVNISHNGNTKLTTLTTGINVTGKIGINETSPDIDLHIKNTNPAIYLEGTNGSGRQHKIWSAGTNSEALQLTSGYLYYNADAQIFRATNETTEYLRIASTGNVSIGTQNVTEGKLQVNGDITAKLQHGSSDMYGMLAARKFDGNNALGGYAIRFASGYESPWIIGYNAGSSYDNQITFGSMTTSDRSLATGVQKRMVIDMETGKVGINTDNPSQHLTVQGTILKTRSDSGLGLIYLQNDGSNNGLININQNAGVTRVKLNSAGDSYFNGGDLSLGTTSPNSYTDQRVLTINGTTYGRLDLEVGGTLKGSVWANSGGLGLDAGGNDIEMFTGSQQRVKINTSGQMGIGQGFSPSRHLDVKDSTGANRIMNIRGTGTSGAFLAFLDANTTDDSKCRIGSIGGNSIGIRGDEHKFQNGAGTNRMVITSGGDVGVGNDSPNCRLAVKDVAEHTAYNSVTPSVGDCMLQLYNNPPNETANDHATIQFGVNGGSHNRVNTISAVAESAGNRKMAFTFCTDEAGSRTEKLRINSSGLVKILGDGGNDGFYLSNAYGQAGIFGGMYYNGSSWVRAAAGTRLPAGMYVNTGGHVVFLKAPENSGTSATVTESFRITAGGNVKIGGHTSGSSTGGEDKLNIKGSGTQFIYIGSDDASGAGVYFDGDSNGDMSGSDYARIMHNTDGYMQYDNWKSGGGHRFALGGNTRLEIKSDGAIENTYVDEKRGIAPIYRDHVTLTTSWQNIARITGYANATMFRFVFEGQASGTFWNGYADIMVGHYRQYKIKLHNGGSYPVDVRLFGNGSGTCDLQVKTSGGNSGTLGFNIIPSTFEADGTVVFTNTGTMSDSSLEILGVKGTVSKSYTAKADDFKVWGSIASGSVSEPAVLKTNSTNSIKYFEHYFNCVKGGSGNSHVVNQDIVTITGLGNFHQASFTADFGVRLQGQGDQYTRPALWQTGVNRFNGASSINFEEFWRGGDSAVQTYANLHAVEISATEYRIRMNWASGTYGSSFASGKLSGYFVNDQEDRDNVTFAYGWN